MERPRTAGKLAATPSVDVLKPQLRGSPARASWQHTPHPGGGAATLGGSCCTICSECPGRRRGRPGWGPSGAERWGWPRAPTPPGGLPVAPAASSQPLLTALLPPTARLSPHSRPPSGSQRRGLLPPTAWLSSGLCPCPSHYPRARPKTQVGGLSPHLRTCPLSSNPPLLALPLARGRTQKSCPPWPARPPAASPPVLGHQLAPLSGLLWPLAPEHLGCRGS